MTKYDRIFTVSDIDKYQLLCAFRSPYGAEDFAFSLEEHENVIVFTESELLDYRIQAFGEGWKAAKNDQTS